MATEALGINYVAMWLPRDKQTNQKIIRMSKNTTAQTLPLKQTFLQLRLYFNVGTKVPLKSAKVFFCSNTNILDVFVAGLCLT